MPKINILPENLVNKIAAGEVIERPASCVKELIENSIDSGADEIILEVGVPCDTFLKITDNGCGMCKEDAILAFESHATSKISTQDDLFKIKTMGFRGEALASIASISHVKLYTKERGKDLGTFVDISGNKINKVEEISRKDGTQIEIENIFYNTPARKKFLKNDQTEYGHILDIFTNIAMINPQISFKLVKNNKSVLILPKTHILKDRISNILGNSISDFMIPVFYGGANLKIEGFIGKPQIARTNKKNQYFFVNNRKILDYILSHAVGEAFGSTLQSKVYPVCVVKIDIEPSQVDVNVHPRKLEVRFVNQKEIYSALYNSIKSSLEKNVLAPKIFTQNENFKNYQKNVKGLERYDQKNLQIQKYNNKSEYPLAAPSQALNFSKQLLENIKLDFDSSNKGIIPLAQLADSYILAEEKGKGLVIIDQHAAHERIIYAELADILKNKKKISQKLIVPIILELSHREIETLNQNLKYLEELGFEIETFSGGSFIINSIPQVLQKEDIKEIMLGVIDDLVEDMETKAVQNIQEKITHYIACRSAVKFGKNLNYSEQVALIKKLEDTEGRYTCPHGRPTILSLTFQDLAKKFKR